MKHASLVLMLLALAGCGGAGTVPLAGRALLGSGGCGAPPPEGVCPNPVVYSGFAGACLRVFPELGETLVATTTADGEGRFTLGLPTGTYRVVTEQLPGTAVLMTVGTSTTPVMLSFYLPPP